MENTWKVVLAFGGIFVAGGVTGGLIALRVATPHAAPAPVVETPAPTAPPVTTNSTPTTPANLTQAAPANVVPPRPAPEQLGPQLFRRLTNQLDLSPDQKRKIRPIELRATEEINRLRRDSVHATQVLIDKNEDEIRGVLTPEQAAKFDVMVSAQRDRIAKFVIEQQERQRELRKKMFPPPGKAGVIATPASVPAGGDEKK